MIKILFACVGNSCRSQMAEGFCRVLSRDVECVSAGTQPEEAVSPEAIGVMQEAGVDISKAKPKSFSDLPDLKFDYLVTMGCEVECPFIPGVRRIEWNIPDPKGKSLDEFRRVRDIIREKVRELLAQIRRED
ncbi:MAG: arsenate reductase ArsC [candidate division WOR-3 bacterium]|nr:arsenate reductase ArsC [candidate division WOR-3 bacterium]MCR4424470.1 arsenate reductase ArsC [candidate division WOR-3 bacterium]MDH7519682.1 arsenate reductase ArsC [bacterium]